VDAMELRSRGYGPRTLPAATPSASGGTAYPVIRCSADWAASWQSTRSGLSATGSSKRRTIANTRRRSCRGWCRWCCPRWST
ncbi:hypothetical protein LPJ70_004025, partial [Coemansia sp. RSA 2708]